MNDMQHFDNHIKNAFDDYAPDVPAGSWEKIMQERNRRKLAPVWWHFMKGKSTLLLTGLLLVTATGVGVYRYFQAGNKIIVQNPATEIAAATKQNTIAATGPDQSDVKNETAAGQNIDKTSGLQHNIEPAVSSGNNNIAGATNGNDKKEIRKEGSVNKTASTGINKTGGAAASKAGSNVIINYNDGQQVENLAGTNLPGTKKQLIKKTKGRTTAQSQQGELEDGIDEPAVAANFLTQGTLLERLKFDAEKISSASLVSKESSEKKIGRLSIADPGCPTLEKDAAANKQYWELYGGPDYVFKKYTDTANSAYLEKRKSSTSFQSAFSAGARYTRVFNNGISIRAGINFSQVNEKFSFLQDNFIQVTYITNAAGDTTGSYSTRGTRYKTSYNHYKTIDVPVQVGYELGNGRLHANLNAGAVVNIYSWQKGDLLDTSFQPVNITTGKGASQYEYKNNIGIGFIGAVSVYYKLNDRLHVLAEPFFRYNFSPMNNDNFSLQEKFTTIGLRLGIRMDLR